METAEFSPRMTVAKICPAGNAVEGDLSISVLCTKIQQSVFPGWEINKTPFYSSGPKLITSSSSKTVLKYLLSYFHLLSVLTGQHLWLIPAVPLLRLCKKLHTIHSAVATLCLSGHEG